MHPHGVLCEKAFAPFTELVWGVGYCSIACHKYLNSDSGDQSCLRSAICELSIVFRPPPPMSRTSFGLLDEPNANDTSRKTAGNVLDNWLPIIPFATTFTLIINSDPWNNPPPLPFPHLRRRRFFLGGGGFLCWGPDLDNPPPPCYSPIGQQGGGVHGSELIRRI